MEKFIVAFVVIFCVCTSAGFLNGRSDSREPEQLKLIAASKVKVIFEKDVALLTLELDPGVASWVYNVDTDQVTTLDPQLRIDMANGNTLPLNDKAIGAFVGTAAGWTLKDVITAIAKSEGPSQRSGYFGAILGGVSGYFVGHRYGVAFERKNAREVLVPVLRNSGNEIAQLVFAVLYRQYHRQLDDEIFSLSDGQDAIALKRRLDKMATVVREAVNPGTDMKSRHFLIFRGFLQ